MESRLAEAGELALEVARPVADVMLDLETLGSQEAQITSEAAVGAHLTALNKLRRELINNFPNDKEALAKVDEAVNRGLKIMENVHV